MAVEAVLVGLTELLTKSLSMEAHVESSCAVVSLVVVGCGYALRLSSHLLAVFLFKEPFCFVTFDGYRLDDSFVQRSWCRAIILTLLVNRAVRGSTT